MAPIQKLPKNNFQFGIQQFPENLDLIGIAGPWECSQQLVPVQCSSPGSDQSVLLEPEPRSGICSALGAAPCPLPLTDCIWSWGASPPWLA